MGCDYYIYDILKIIHTAGSTHIKLKTERGYTYQGYFDGDSNLIPDKGESIIYEKGHRIFNDFLFVNEMLTKYGIVFETLLDEIIKENTVEGYESKNKYLIENDYFNHPDTGEKLKSIDIISKVSIIELREWRR